MEIYENLPIDKWVTENLLSPRNRINAMWTRENFRYLKKKWPDVWKYIKGKTFYGYLFDDKILSPIIKVNGHLYQRPNYKYIYPNELETTFWKAMIEIDGKNDIFEVIDIIAKRKVEGFSLLRYLNRWFPDNNIKDYYEKCQPENETIYRYRYDIKERPKINGKKLKFGTYETGYYNYDVYEIYIKNNKNIKDTISEIYCNKQTRFLMQYFPNVQKKIKEKYKKFGFLPKTNLYMYINDMDEPPRCKWCNEYVNETVHKNPVFFDFCCNGCAGILQSIQYMEKNIIKLGKSWMKEKNKYQKLCRKYTQHSYILHKNKINPNGYKREQYIPSKYKTGKRVHHLDHIIPIVYGFCKNIPPEIIGHWKNLQMISGKKNIEKGGVLLISENKANKIIEDIKYDNM